MEKQKCLGDVSLQKISNNLYITLVRGISLQEYCTVLPCFCNMVHAQPCSECHSCISLAKLVLDSFIVPLGESYRIAFPTLDYHLYTARRKVLQLPLVGLLLGNPPVWHLMEYKEAIDYSYLISLLNVVLIKENSLPSREQLQSMLSLAQNQREKDLISSTFYLASGVSSSKARSFGLYNMAAKMEKVNEAIRQVRGIHDAVNELVMTKDEAILRSLGYEGGSETSDSDTEYEAINEVSTGEDGVEGDKSSSSDERFAIDDM